MATHSQPIAPPNKLGKSVRRLRKILCLEDFASAAERHLPHSLFNYIAGACEDGVSFEDNRIAFQDYRFKPRVLRDVSGRDLSVTLLGRRYAAPFGIAPMGIAALSTYRGDLVLAEAARTAGIPAIMSGASLIKMESVAAHAPGTWFQAYVPGDERRIGALLNRVEHAGFETLVVTVDIPVLANRENNVRAGFSTPIRPGVRLMWSGLCHPRWTFSTLLRTLVRHGIPHFENMAQERGAPIFSNSVTRDFANRDRFTWAHVSQIRRRWKGPLIIKGILSPADARIAQATGADGIIVSNHGGRQLDGAASGMEMLEQVVEAGGENMPVMVDGGFRRGTDVLKAIALGARMVFVGRPFNFAAAVGGLDGVSHAIALLRSEIDRDMAMLGVDDCSRINSDYLITSHRGQRHVLSK